MMDPIFLNPVFKDYIWGGNKLKKVLKKDVDNENCTAESWEISTNENGKSIIKNGIFKDKTLDEIFKIDEQKEKIFGRRCVNLSDFPLLIKFIDANKSLSIQVHPDDEYAKEHEKSLGKTEMWYILECDPGAKIICGMNENISKEKLKEYILEGNKEKISDSLRYIDVQKGDCIYIPSGTIHALLGNTLVAEVQQNSNITYRVYDWGRIGNDGKPRELHIDKAIDVIKEENQPKLIHTENNKECQSIVDSKYFKTDKIKIENQFIEAGNVETFYAINVIEGNGTLEICDKTYEIKKGDSFIIPSITEEYKLKGKIEILKSYI